LSLIALIKCLFVYYIKTVWLPSGARHSQVVDEAVVRIEARLVAHLQEPKDKEQPLGGHSDVDLVSGD